MPEDSGLHTSLLSLDERMVRLMASIKQATAKIVGEAAPEAAPTGGDPGNLMAIVKRLHARLDEADGHLSAWHKTIS